MKYAAMPAPAAISPMDAARVVFLLESIMSDDKFVKELCLEIHSQMKPCFQQTR